MTIGIELNHRYLRAAARTDGKTITIRNDDGTPDFPVEPGEEYTVRKALGKLMLRLFAQGANAESFIILTYPMDMPLQQVESARRYLREKWGIERVRIKQAIAVLPFLLLQQNPKLFQAESKMLFMDVQTGEAGCFDVSDDVIETLYIGNLRDVLSAVPNPQQIYLTSSQDKALLDAAVKQCASTGAEIRAIRPDYAMGAAVAGIVTFGELLALDVCGVAIGIRTRQNAFLTIMEEDITIPTHYSLSVSRSWLDENILPIRYGTDLFGYQEIAIPVNSDVELTVDIDTNRNITLTVSSPDGRSVKIDLSREMTLPRFRDPFVQQASLLSDAQLRDELTLLDDLQRSIHYLRQSGSPQTAAGLENIETDFLELLADTYNIRPYHAKYTKFDPQIHYALETARASDVEPDTVIEVRTPGYLRGISTFRISEVVVSK